MNLEIDQLIENFTQAINSRVLGKFNDSYDILSFAKIQAAFESAKYYNEKMIKAININNSHDLLTHALSIKKIEGQILEFGVNSGGTVNHIAGQVKQNVYGFDVFSGLPETWRTGFEKGLFIQESLPKVRDNVHLVVGLFEDTLDEFIETHKDPISLLHVDCDLYGGTKTIFSKLGHLIVPGTVIVFDEYFNYPGWQHHEFKAFQEFINYKNIRYHYNSFVSVHQQVCVVID